MILIEMNLDLHFEDCALGFSARRIWEYTQLQQVNPFPPISPARAINPQDYVDIVEVSGPSQALTGLTLSGFLHGERKGLSQSRAEQLMEHTRKYAVRRWLTRITRHLYHFSGQIAVRNSPGLFLSEDHAGPLGVDGIHCALATWLKAHGKERATLKQWANRINKLARKGLRSDEMEFSGMRAYLARALGEAGEEPGPVITADDLYKHLNYKQVLFSILPVVRLADDNHLTFLKVPANKLIKRIKPKVKTGTVTHPQWYDRVMGYWVDEVVWNDLLGHQRRWMSFTYQGKPVTSGDKPSGLCATNKEARALADNHAKHVLPRLTAKGSWSKYRLTGGEQYREWLVTLPHYKQSFFSDHFKHRNVLFHVRCDIRESGDDERVLLIQEVQSDWAQKARRASRGDNHSSQTVPVPPWLNEWPTLALKLMLLHAAQKGASALAWTRGRVQVERYNGLGERGLLNLYDHVLPTELTRILQPYRKTCEIVEVFQPANFYIEPAVIGYEVLDERHNHLGTAATWEAAQALLPDCAHEVLMSMHGIRLDEALRQELLKNGFCAWGAGVQ